MKYRVYIQSLNGVPTDDWGFMAYLGFKRRQLDIFFFEDIEEVPRSKYNIVVGYIETTIKFFNDLGISLDPLHIPEQLLKYTNREINYMSMGDYLDNYNKFPVFVKPDSKIKEFITGVITRPSSKEFFTNVDKNTRIQVSEVVNFLSEYRGFVIDGELKSLQHYIGELDYYPNVSIIREAIKDYKSAPIGYSIDFGVTEDGKTSLIECNDG